MLIKSAEFFGSVADYKKCPKPELPEYAFIGRSNVGKSSLINAICNNSKLAKTSSTPGKTQTINHFLINKNWYLVDLPGYGYAKSSKMLREKWYDFILGYFENRENLVCTFVLIDSRLAPQQIDLDFMALLVETEIPFVIVFTKTDKLSQADLGKNLRFYKKKMLETWEEMPQNILTSAEKKRGMDQVLDLIDELNASYGK